ncbi:GNAT family N-acetyltransferase [Streptomyces sp. UNOC14_S4]|uniref:GNAT family N-acetyltransferase n=1 Tax=Streptomyces sp. UNOC14_S4 TaxID=2872340 RepID=UPI001E2CC083|nr:GNAT family protein [Streptomyces sp. UNOC14_S4]MCC3772690.1 GNAT family N-acetyltransferase [Streptomyces sp. UNOC14_S4]
MEHTIRLVRPEEWREARELRLLALSDPVAPIAFLTTYDEAVARTDERWQQMAHTPSFVAEGPDGEWAGSVTILVEVPGDDSVFGGGPVVPQTHLVGVFLRPEHRGTGLAEALLQAALDWSWSLGDPRVERVRLHVHERNVRAEGLYRKLGFERTGVTVLMEGDPSALEHEMAVGRPAV